MQLRRLGSTGFVIPPLVFGVMYLAELLMKERVSPS